MPIINSSTNYYVIVFLVLHLYCLVLVSLMSLNN